MLKKSLREVRIGHHTFSPVKMKENCTDQCLPLEIT